MSTVQTYTGDGVQKNFTFSFPYISTTHVKVFVNDTLQLSPMHYSLSGSTVSFSDAPEVDAGVVIKRQTSPSDILVDFADGSTLREADLDTAYLHNFYLSQEYADGFSNLINDAFLRIADGTGITETEPDEVIAALVNELLNQAAANDIQQRVNDIDTNAESILSLGENLQVQINTLASGVAAVVYIQAAEPVPGVGGIPDPIVDGARWYDSDDNNKPYIYDASVPEWVSIEDPRIGQAAADISVLQTDVSDNAAAIVTEQLARSTADSAIASELSLLGAQNGTQTAFIVDTSTVKIDADGGDTLATRLSTLAAADSANSASITTLETVTLPDLQARYGVSLNVNGYVTGFLQNNDGEFGNFVILADRFAVVDPSGDPGEAEYVPFEIDNGKINLRGDVQVDGSLIVNGTVNGVAIVAGGIGSTQIGANAITTDKLNANVVTAAKLAAGAVTATKINVSELSAITADLGDVTGGTFRSGQTDYDTGTGFWLGTDGGTPKFSIGSATRALLWDGANLRIRGGLITEGGFIQLNDQSPFTTVFSPASATTTYKLTSSKLVETGSPIENWLIGGGYDASDFDCRMLPVSGTVTTGTVNTWLNLGTTRTWTVSRSGIGSKSFTGTIQLRLVSTGEIVDQATINMTAEVESGS